MKILVVSLLRLGDILLATSVLRSLKKRHPKAEIHILINGQFQGVANLIPCVNKVYTFDRSGIQEIIGTSDHNLLEAYFRVEDLVEQLQTERYDRVINLTHNRLSGWLSALIGCSKTQGVVFGSGGKASMGSQWFEYLNEIADIGQQNTFHFVDVFHYGAGLDNTDRRIELQETAAGRAFTEELLNGRKTRRRILIQPGSSEAKKTFKPAKWREIALQIQRQEKDSDIFILGAPAERPVLNEICEGLELVPVVCSLEEAFSLLARSQLLITPDTSIKHLAAATKARVVEVSIGSSEFRKTGVYAHGAVIIQSLAPCAPCPHRGPCSQRSHLCADGIPGEMVALVASALLRQDEPSLRVIAHEFKGDALTLKTRIDINGDWSAYPLAERFSKEQIAPWVDRASFKLYLQKAHEKQVGEFGTEGLELKQLLQSIFPDHSWREWVSELRTIENNVTWIESQLGSYLSRLKSVLTNLEDPEAMGRYLDDLRQLSKEMERSPVLESYGQQISATLKEAEAGVPFQIVKSLREKLSSAHQRTKIELKLIRGLQSGFMEIV